MASLGKRKNSNGETIWVIRYRIGKKQKLKTIGKTDKRTAQQVLLKFEAELAKNSFGIQELRKTILRDFVEEYLRLSETGKARNTYLREKRILTVFSEHFKDLFLHTIETQDIEHYRMKRLQQVSEETVNLEFRHLKAIFNRARSFHYLERNPFDGIKPIRVPESDLPRFFELEEIPEVLDAFTNDPFLPLIKFYLYTGARLREALALTWKDIDFRRKLITIRSTHTKAKRHRLISVKDDENLEVLIKSLPRREDGFLFGPPNDAPLWTPWWVSRKISLRLTKQGFPWASAHTFRHTFISHLIMQGVPVLTVKELVGHSNINTTLKYAHLAPGHKEKMQGRRPY